MHERPQHYLSKQAFWVSPGKAVIRSINPSALPLQAVDFDPHSLRNILPQAAAIVHERLQRGDRLYVHCTAGLGRAPAVCIAYLYWFQGMTLDAVSPCLLCSGSCVAVHAKMCLLIACGSGHVIQGMVPEGCMSSACSAGFRAAARALHAWHSVK